ncbi:MAG: hypothetical protein ACI9FJ_001189 [Alteromonadaceae bacterium]|jgi:hypothetical protein
MGWFVGNNQQKHRSSFAVIVGRLPVEMTVPSERFG